MPALSVRGIDHEVYERLRLRAAGNGRSMEAEVRNILAEAVRESDENVNLGVALMQHFGALGGVELDLPARTTPRPPPDFSGPEFGS